MKRIYVVALTILLPMVTLAADPPGSSSGGVGEFDGIKDFVSSLVKLLNETIVPAIFALAFLVFIWGMFTTFILGGQSEEKQAAGRQLMLWAVIGFVFMISIWGIVNLVTKGLNLNDNQIKPPTFELGA